MVSFWNAERDLTRRFDGIDVDERSAQPWASFLEALRVGEDEDEPAAETVAGWRAALSHLAMVVQDLPGPTLVVPRVFISHRKDALPSADRIAYLASQEAGLEYWLDAHDQTMRLANRTISPTHPRHAFIIAAIVEMALLNCSLVIAAHTPPPTGQPQWIPSQWIPYELARAKSRRVYSNRAAGWFQSSVRPPTVRGEYVVLADIRLSDDEVRLWLRQRSPAPDTKQPFHGSVAPPPKVLT